MFRERERLQTSVQHRDLVRVWLVFNGRGQPSTAADTDVVLASPRRVLHQNTPALLRVAGSGTTPLLLTSVWYLTALTTSNHNNTSLCSARDRGVAGLSETRCSPFPSTRTPPENLSAPRPSRLRVEVSLNV